MVGAGVYCVRPEVSHAFSLVRGPASVRAPKAVVQMNVMDVPCWNRLGTEPRSAAARWVRLTGKACASDVSVEGITVRNLTNGFAATVFATGPGLTTDYIPLNDGTNDVVIAYARGVGAPLEHRLQLTR